MIAPNDFVCCVSDFNCLGYRRYRSVTISLVVMCVALLSSLCLCQMTKDSIYMINDVDMYHCVDVFFSWIICMTILQCSSQ